jgi:hypothetical protein
MSIRDLQASEPEYYGRESRSWRPWQRVSERAEGVADEGLKLLNFNVEAQCTPSRVAIMNGCASSTLPPGSHASSSVLASRRSGVLKPSVNLP